MCLMLPMLLFFLPPPLFVRTLSGEVETSGRLSWIAPQSLPVCQVILA